MKKKMLLRREGARGRVGGKWRAERMIGESMEKRGAVSSWCQAVGLHQQRVGVFNQGVDFKRSASCSQSLWIASSSFFQSRLSIVTLVQHLEEKIYWGRKKEQPTRTANIDELEIVSWVRARALSSTPLTSYSFRQHFHAQLLRSIRLKGINTSSWGWLLPSYLPGNHSN